MFEITFLHVFGAIWKILRIRYVSLQSKAFVKSDFITFWYDFQAKKTWKDMIHMKLDVVWIHRGKNASRNFQYEWYSWIDVMELHFCLSCSQDHCADPKKHHFSSVHRDLKFMRSDKSCVIISQNHTSKLDEVFLKLPSSSDFGLEPRIFQIGWFYRPKWK